MTAGCWGRGPLPAGKMVAAEHKILEKQHSSHMETGGLARLFGPHPRCGARRVTFVMSSSRSRSHGARPPLQCSSSVAALSSDATERSTMTATEDAYWFEFAWIDGDRLPFDP